MKNHDEFRQTVFEKATRYRAKQKARRKKLVESVSLCSLCAVIGISVYFAYGKSGFAPESIDTCHSTTADSSLSPQETGNTYPIETITTMDVWASSTFAHTTCTTVAYTTCATTPQMTFSSSTYESTISTDVPSSEEETNSTCPAEDLYTVHHSIPCETDDPAQDDVPKLFVYRDRESFHIALENELFSCLTKDQRKMLSDAFDNAFFENNVVILFHVSQNKTWDVTLENGRMKFITDPTDATGDTAHIVYVFSVSKEHFVSAEITGKAP